MRIAIVGCGFVADYYMTTLVNHPGLDLVGVFDRDAVRATAFGGFHGVRVFPDLASLLADPSVEMIWNLTNPSSHFAVSKIALEAGKHVWSEKPLAMAIPEAEELVALAAARRLSIASAPCSFLGESALAIWESIDRGRIGRPRLVYAEMEDSMVFLEDHRKWRSRSGAPWPAEDEFAVGATLEHAGYYLTWLCAFFGPVAEMTAFSTRLFDDKGTGQPPETLANDFSVTCLTFRSGTVARLTCGLAAPVDRSFHVVGDEGMLSISDGWNVRASVYQRDAHGRSILKAPKLAKILEVGERNMPFRQWFSRRLPLMPARGVTPPYASRIDFSRGPAEIAAAIEEDRALPITADFSLHVTELSLVIQDARKHPMPYRPASTFEPLPRPHAA